MREINEVTYSKIYPWVKKEIFDSMVVNADQLTDVEVLKMEFLEGLSVIFAVDKGDDKYEILTKSNMDIKVDLMKIFEKACENLVKDVEFVISQTLYGGYGIVCDGIHEASSVLYKSIWSMCANELDDDILIMIPSKDMVLFAPKSKSEIVTSMVIYANEAYDRNIDCISKDVYLFTKEEKELQLYKF